MQSKTQEVLSSNHRYERLPLQIFEAEGTKRSLHQNNEQTFSLATLEHEYVQTLFTSGST